MTDREQILDLLGPDARDARFIEVKTVVSKQAFGTTLNRLVISLESGEVAEGIYLEPRAPNAPALLYCHAHGGRYDIGHHELIDGRPALRRPYLEDLARAGFAVLCFDMPCFASRARLEEGALSKARLWQGRTLFGQMIGELRAGLQFLSNIREVNPDRIGTFGISMGGTHAWWLNAIDARVKASAALCCFCDLETLITDGGHDKHGHYMTVPGLLGVTTTGNLAGLAAPSAQFHGAGLRDWSTPKAAFARARQELERAYASCPEQLEFYVDPDTGHEDTEAMRSAALRFLGAKLGTSN